MRLSGYRGTGGPQNDAHAVEITFFGEIDVEKSKYVVNSRNIPMVLFRKEEGEYWPRLLKEKTKVCELTQKSACL